ncbi:MAG: hypothetical protein H0U98_04460 [Alphaproteobacteria bacterium]|nr:hypothetical protein [Alphaproteobacteria bacterium]
MAITDIDSAGLAFDPAPQPRNFDDGVPHAALSRLPALHGEASRNMQLSQFLARSPQACIALMLAGVLVLFWAAAGAGPASLKADFAWGSLVLIGIVGMTRNYIRGFARSLRRVPLQEAASDLRMLLLYTGAAWGAGAFLIMPELPAPALVFIFAAAPALAAAAILRDTKGVSAFILPSSAAIAAAAMLGAWPLDAWVAAAVLVAGSVIAGLTMLHCAMRGRRTARLGAS